MILGGSLLYGGFTLVYSTLLPILYLPLLIMIGALIFRGVSLEFRFKAGHYRHGWERAFAAGSVLAAACQGFILGLFVKGHAVKTEWGPFPFLTAFSVSI